MFILRLEGAAKVSSIHPPTRPPTHPPTHSLSHTIYKEIETERDLVPIHPPTHPPTHLQAYSATRSKELNSVTLWVTTLLCLVWAGVEWGVGGGSGGWEVVGGLWEEDWKQVVYLGVVTTAICNWIQTLGQREVPAEKVRVLSFSSSSFELSFVDSLSFILCSSIHPPTHLSTYPPTHPPYRQR